MALTAKGKVVMRKVASAEYEPPMDRDAVREYRGRVAEILNAAGVEAVGNQHLGGGIEGIEVRVPDRKSSLISWLDDGGEFDAAWTMFDWSDDDGNMIATVTLQSRPCNARFAPSQRDGTVWVDDPASPFEMAREIACFLRAVSAGPTDDGLADALLNTVFADYAESITHNHSVEFPAVRNVATDDTGEAFHEVIDTAHAYCANERGEVPDYVWERIHTRFGDWQAELFAWVTAVDAIVDAKLAAIVGRDVAPVGYERDGNDDLGGDNVFIEHHDVILTVGRLRALLEDMPDDYHVTIATNAWYDNIECVQVPNVEREDHAPCVNLFGHDYMTFENGTYDPRQH